MPMALARGLPVTIAMDLMGGACLTVGTCLDAHEAITHRNKTKQNFLMHPSIYRRKRFFKMKIAFAGRSARRRIRYGYHSDPNGM